MTTLGEICLPMDETEKGTHLDWNEILYTYLFLTSHKIKKSLILYAVILFLDDSSSEDKSNIRSVAVTQFKDNNFNEVNFLFNLF